MDEQNLQAVNAIKITYAQVDEGEKAGDYTLTLQWKADLAGTEPDTYWVWLIRDGQTVQTQKAEECEAEMECTGLDPKQNYYVVVSDHETGYDLKKCPMVLLAFRSIEGLACVYDGQRVTLRWKRPEESILFTDLYAEGERCEVPSSRCHASLELEAADLSDSDASPGLFQVEACSFINDISSGPVKMSGWLYVRSAQLTSVTFQQDAEDSVTLQAAFTHPYLDQEGVMARLALVGADGADLLCQEPQNLEKGKDSYMLSFSTNGKYDWQSCWVRVDLCGEGSVSRLPSPWVNQVPLARPEIVGCETRPNSLTLRWNYPAGVQAGFGLQWGQTSIAKGAVRSAQLPATGPQDLDQAVEVWAVSPDGTCSAPHTVWKPFAPGYYPAADGGAKLCLTGYSDNTLELLLPGNAFGAALTAAISSGVLRIDPEKPQILEISTADVLTAEQWTKFRTALLQAGVTPEGYYAVCRQVSRAARMSPETQLNCLCGLNAAHRQVDLVPGMVLTVSAASYQLQPDPDAQLNEGFVQGAQAAYPIHLAQLESSSVLSLDALLHAVQPGWESGIVPEDHPNLRLWAGAGDFFRRDVRAAYGRICYPQRYLDPDQLPTRYPSDNALILLSNSLDTLDTAAEELYADPTTEIATPYLQCVGRGMWGLSQSVWVQGAERLLPVGTTLGSLLLQQGIDSPVTAAQQGALRMWRRTPFGQLPVNLAWFEEDKTKALLLLGGDRIEVYK